jgi:hypothetical protein
MRRHQTEHSSLCWNLQDRRMDRPRHLLVGSRQSWTTDRPQHHILPPLRPLRSQISPSRSHHHLRDSSRLRTRHTAARGIRTHRSLQDNSLTTYLPNQACTRTHLRCTIRRPRWVIRALHFHRSQYIPTVTMARLTTLHLVLRNRHTLQTNSAFHNSLLARSLLVYRVHINSRGSSTRTRHNRTILYRLPNMHSRLLKLALCCHLSKCRLRIRREFTHRQPQQRNTLKCRRPQAIATFRSQVGRRYIRQELVDKGFRPCIR